MSEILPKKADNAEIAQLNPYVRFANRLEGAESSNHIIPWRILYDFEMIFVTQGKLRVLKEDSDYTLNAGCLHIMSPFIRHKRIVPEGERTNYFSVHLDFVFDESSPDFSAEEVYQVPCENKLSTVPDDEKLLEGRKNYKHAIIGIVENYEVKNKPRFTELFNKLYESFKSGGIINRLNTKAYMILLISEFIRDLESQYDKTYADVDYVAQFIDYVTNHYADGIDLNEIVKEYGISPGWFRVVFKNQMNRTPWEFVIDCRIEQAKHLLLTGRYNMSEVSYMVGYDDIHYFSRLFKNKVGCTPTEFIKKNSDG